MLEYKPIINTIQVATDRQLDVLRLDALHSEISGNKWFKLKYNLIEAKKQNFKTILTFGGASSNHIAATAAACQQAKVNCIGLIRGERILNPTLEKAENQGMKLVFVDRKTYNLKHHAEYQSELQKRFGDFYLIPEGGNNKEGIKGCTEILKQEWDYDYIFCSCGTGATYAGLYLSLKPGQILIGISVLKGENTLQADVKNSIKQFSVQALNIGGNEVLEQAIIDKSSMSNLFSLSGYAAYDKELVEFKSEFERQHGIFLDHIYTVKLFYAVMKLIAAKRIRTASKILVIHSGGLQGNKGFEERYHLKPTR